MLNSKDNGQTGIRILLEAMSKDKVHLAKFVLDALDGQIVDSTADGARTPLITSVLLPDARARCEFTELLLRKGASVNRRDAAGRSALSHASETGRLDAVKVLVRNNADPDLADAWGNTALMYAAAAGQTQVVEFLVKAFRRLGLQIDKRNQAGNSAIDVAKFLGHTECVLALTNFSKRKEGGGQVEFFQTCDQTQIRYQKQRMKLNLLPSVDFVEEKGDQTLEPLLFSNHYLQATPNMDEKQSSDHSLPPVKFTALHILLSPLASKLPAEANTEQMKGVEFSNQKKRCSLPSESTLVPARQSKRRGGKPVELISAAGVSVLSSKLLRRFTSPELDPGMIPRSETVPQVRHPQVDSTLSVDSISSVKCEFDSQFRKTKS